MAWSTRFHLRPNVKFHSGDPVTAQDVVYSLTRSLSPKIASPVGLTYLGNIAGAADYFAGKASSVSGLKAIDPLTVQITLSKPYAYWINVMAYPCADVVNPAAVAKNPDGKLTDANCDGTGPFILTKYVHGEAVDLKANPAYWAGAPKIAGQHRPILTNADTRHEEFLAGELDICEESQGGIDYDMSNPRLKDELKIYPRAESWYIAFGERTQPIFKNPLLRQAFAYATDKDTVVKTVFEGRRIAAQDILAKGMPGWDASFQGIPYDPNKAKALMAQAGYPGGKGFPTIEMDASESYPDAQKTIDLLREQYKNILGVNVTTRSVEGNTLIADEVTGNLVTWNQAWIADYLDPQDYYSLLFRTGAQGNHTGYTNPAYDKIVDAADVEQNPAKRAALYRQAAKILANDVPMIPMYYGDRAELTQPWVHGIDDSVINRLPYKDVYFSK